MLGLKDLIERHDIVLIIDEPYNESRLALIGRTPEQELKLNKDWDSDTDIRAEVLNLLGIRYEI